METNKLYIIEHILASGLKDREIEEKANLNKGDLKNIKRGSLPNPLKLQQLFKYGLEKSIEEAFCDPYSEDYVKIFGAQKSTKLGIDRIHELDLTNQDLHEKVSKLSNQVTELKEEKLFLHEKLSVFGEKYSKILEELLHIQRKSDNI